MPTSTEVVAANLFLSLMTVMVPGVVVLISSNAGTSTVFSVILISRSPTPPVLRVCPGQVKNRLTLLLPLLSEPTSRSRMALQVELVEDAVPASFTLMSTGNCLPQAIPLMSGSMLKRRAVANMETVVFSLVGTISESAVRGAVGIARATAEEKSARTNMMAVLTVCFWCEIGRLG